MRTRLERLTPPGVDAVQELRWALRVWAACALWSLTFLRRYVLARADLYLVAKSGARTLIPGATMPDFCVLLGNALGAFLAAALLTLPLAARHYLYHYQGSRSIYTMRRLPDAWELHRRCWALPLLLALGTLLAALALGAIYYAVYQLLTPDACLRPGQLRQLWAHWIQ